MIEQTQISDEICVFRDAKISLKIIDTAAMCS
jgi:hypothetical protein